jgi:hypothetical protein
LAVSTLAGECGEKSAAAASDRGLFLRDHAAERVADHGRRGAEAVDQVRDVSHDVVDAVVRYAVRVRAIGW